MGTSQIPEPTAETQRQLEMTTSQLALYARDLKRMMERERERTCQLAEVNQQLQSYAKDLKAAFDAEKRKSRELEQTYYDTLLRLTRAARYKDEETGDHLQRLSHYAKTLASHLGVSAAKTCDIILNGAMGVPCLNTSIRVCWRPSVPCIASSRSPMNACGIKWLVAATIFCGRKGGENGRTDWASSARVGSSWMSPC